MKNKILKCVAALISVKGILLAVCIALFVVQLIRGTLPVKTIVFIAVAGLWLYLLYSCDKEK